MESNKEGCKEEERKEKVLTRLLPRLTLLRSIDISNEDDVDDYVDNNLLPHEYARTTLMQGAADFALPNFSRKSSAMPPPTLVVTLIIYRELARRHRTCRSINICKEEYVRHRRLVLPRTLQ